MKTHRAANDGVTLVEVIVVVIIVAAVAFVGFFAIAPRLISSNWSEALKGECAHNLTAIHAAARTYANKRGAFPFAASGGAAPRAHESLNVLLRSSSGRDLQAEHFTCPAGDQTLVNRTEDSEFLQLEESNLSYAWTATRLAGSGAPQNLSSDKFVDEWRDQAGHRSALMLLRSDGSLSELGDEDLDADTGLPPGLVR